MNDRRRIALMISEDANEPARQEEGIPPHDREEHKKYAHADLITLPPDVEGTNCGNCRFAQESEKVNSGHVCTHPDLTNIEINPRMCCKYWDHAAVKRTWKVES